jgi:hypothetical protein
MYLNTYATQSVLPAAPKLLKINVSISDIQ